MTKNLWTIKRMAHRICRCPSNKNKNNHCYQHKIIHDLIPSDPMTLFLHLSYLSYSTTPFFTINKRLS